MVVTWTRLGAMKVEGKGWIQDMVWGDSKQALLMDIFT